MEALNSRWNGAPLHHPPGDRNVRTPLDPRSLVRTTPRMIRRRRRRTPMARTRRSHPRTPRRTLRQLLVLQLAALREHTQPPVQLLVHRHATTGPRTTGTLQLQPTVPPLQRPVVPNHTLLRERQHPLQLHPARNTTVHVRPRTRFHPEPRVVIRQERPLEECVRSLQRVDPRQTQRLHQAVLQRPVRPLHTTL